MSGDSNGHRSATTRAWWRYIADGSRVDVRQRKGGEGTRCSLLLVSLITRLIISWVRLRYRVSIRGAFSENGELAISYHDSYWDGLLVSMLTPRITPVVSKQWRTHASTRWYLSNYHVYWTDEDVVDRSVQGIGEGGIVWLAPFAFGVPADPLTAIRPGAARIIQRARCDWCVVALQRKPGILRGVLTIEISEPRRAQAALDIDALNQQLCAALEQRRAICR